MRDKPLGDYLCYDLNGLIFCEAGPLVRPSERQISTARQAASSSFSSGMRGRQPACENEAELSDLQKKYLVSACLRLVGSGSAEKLCAAARPSPSPYTVRRSFIMLQSCHSPLKQQSGDRDPQLAVEGTQRNQIRSTKVLARRIIGQFASEKRGAGVVPIRK
jgi:hypothetical protein